MEDQQTRFHQVGLKVSLDLTASLQKEQQFGQ